MLQASLYPRCLLHLMGDSPKNQSLHCLDPSLISAQLHLNQKCLVSSNPLMGSWKMFRPLQTPLSTFPMLTKEQNSAISSSRLSLLKIQPGFCQAALHSFQEQSVRLPTEPLTRVLVKLLVSRLKKRICKIWGSKGSQRQAGQDAKQSGEWIKKFGILPGIGRGQCRGVQCCG